MKFAKGSHAPPPGNPLLSLSRNRFISNFCEILSHTFGEGSEYKDDELGACVYESMLAVSWIGSVVLSTARPYHTVHQNSPAAVYCTGKMLSHCSHSQRTTCQVMCEVMKRDS